jgi:hypothetical protein
MLTAVYTGTNVLLYQNGQLVKTYTESTTLLTKPLYIGYTPGDAAPDYFQGSISDVQVYNSVLTAAQIQQLYQQSLPQYNKMNVSLG